MCVVSPLLVVALVTVAPGMYHYYVCFLCSITVFCGSSKLPFCASVHCLLLSLIHMLPSTLVSISVAALERFFLWRSLVWKYDLFWGGDVTSRRLCRLGFGGGVYGCWGFSRASKILFGCTVCSSLSGCYWKIQYMCDIFLPCWGGYFYCKNVGVASCFAWGQKCVHVLKCVWRNWTCGCYF